MNVMAQVNNLTNRTTLFLFRSETFEEEKILSNIVRAIESGDCTFETRRGESVLVSFTLSRVGGGGRE